MKRTSRDPNATASAERAPRRRHRTITTTLRIPATIEQLGFSFDRIVVYRSPLSVLGTMLLVMLTVSLAVVVTRIIPATIIEIPLPFDRVSYLPSMGLIPMIFFLRLIAELLDSKYVLTPKGVVEFHGLLLGRRVRRLFIPYGILREVTVVQGGMARLLRVGDLILRGVEQNSYVRKIVIRGIHQPQAWRTILLEQAKFRPAALVKKGILPALAIGAGQSKPIYHQPGELLVQ